MNTKSLMSCAAVTLLGLGGATPTNVQARGLSIGSFNRPAAAAFAPGISKQRTLGVHDLGPDNRGANVQARGLSLGGNAGRSVIPFTSRNTSAVQDWSGPGDRPGAAAFAPGISKQQALRADSLLKTTNKGAIGLTERTLVRNFGADKDEKHK